MLPLSPSSYKNYRAAHVPCYFLWKRPSHRFSIHVPWALRSTSWVVGCGSWITSNYSYTCMGSALDVMDYGLAKAIGISSRLTVRMLFELCIIMLGLKLRRFFRRTTSKLHILHIHAPYNIYSMNNCFFRFRAF